MTWRCPFNLKMKVLKHVVQIFHFILWSSKPCLESPLPRQTNIRGGLRSCTFHPSAKSTSMTACLERLHFYGMIEVVIQNRFYCTYSLKCNFLSYLYLEGQNFGPPNLTLWHVVFKATPNFAVNFLCFHFAHLCVPISV